MQIKNFSLLLESGIRIPPGTHAAKIVHHQDLDGVFSAIVVYNQLIKQGINPRNITTHWIQYSEDDSSYIQKLKKSKGQMVALVDFAKLPEGAVKPDFWTDHHQSTKHISAGGGKVGATEFKSDTDHLVLLHTENLVDRSTVEVINRIDSASFTNIEDILTLKKDFKEKGRLERLAIICNALLVESGILNDNTLLESFIKSTKPSIVSFYVNILEYNRLNEIQLQAIKELKKPEPDWDLVEKARRAMPNLKAKKRIYKGASVNEGAIEDYQELKDLRSKKRTPKEEERYQELVNKPIEKIKHARHSALQKEKGKDTTFEKRGSTLIQNNPRLQRYIWTQLNTAGIKYPFVIKRYPTFIQVAVNPDLPDEIRDKIDLGAISNLVMKQIRSKFENKYNAWAFDIIEGDSGGHKGITNISSLGTLGIMNKADRDELKYFESLEGRIKALKKINKDMSDEDKEKLSQAQEMLDKKEIQEVDYDKLKKLLSSPMRRLMPQHFAKMQELKDKKAERALERKKIMDEIVEEFINQFELRFGASKQEPVMSKNKNVKLTGGKKEYEFESLNTILDELL